MRRILAIKADNAGWTKTMDGTAGCEKELFVHGTLTIDCAFIDDRLTSTVAKFVSAILSKDSKRSNSTASVQR
jgi:hypothetical protein